MKAIFLHPRDSRTFEADVDPETTGGQCIDALITAKFIDPAPSGRPYTLTVTRTRTQILPATTMQEAGVVDGDHVAVQQMEQGAA